MSELTAINNSIISIGNDLVQVVPSVDPYNPLGLPPFTIRIKYSSGYIPEPQWTTWDSKTLVDASENVWDITKNSTNWHNLFIYDRHVLEVLGANTTGITTMEDMFLENRSLISVSIFDTSSCQDMTSMFGGCRSLTSIPLFDTSLCYLMSEMFRYCYNVESGALALYQQASTQTNPPAYHQLTFDNCGRDTVTGAAELAQIPSSWGGTGV